MNNKTRAEKIAQIINDERGIKAEVTTKVSNGVESIGITLGDGTVRPTLYPAFDSTNDINKLIDKIIEDYKRVSANNPHKEFEDIVNHFTEFDFVKSGLVPCLVRSAQDDLVQRDFLDLKVMYRYKFNDASIAIKKEHLEMWNVTEDELFQIAKDNVFNEFIDMSMEEALGMPLPGDLMRVITTKDRTHGASALLFPELFATYGNDVKILPSSIHEVIVLMPDAAKDTQTEMLVDMITTVNATELVPQDILSNHPYTYVDGEIREVV